MVNLLNLLNFASKYYYTESTDNLLFKNYLENIKYKNGSILITEATSDVIVEQNMNIIIENNNNITLTFDYLPIEQTVKIKVNNTNISDVNITRDEDIILINNTNNINQLKVTVSKYTDSDGITFKGLNKTINALFNLQNTIIFKDNKKWYLQSEGSFDINTLTTTNNVTLTNYNTDEFYCQINFTNNNPVSFNITKNNNTNYFGLKCTYSSANDDFNIGVYYYG